MTFDIGFLLEILPTILAAAVVTITATVGGFSLAVVLGLLLALLRMAAIPLVSLGVAGVVQFIRMTPLLIQLFVLFYVLPIYGIVLDPLTTGILALGIHYSTYTSEVYRAGIEAVSPGQWEAATALNLPRARTWRRIVLPQAIPPMVPALGNYLIGMFKETAVLSTITVTELLSVALREASASFRYVEPFLIIGVIYLTLSLVAAFLIRVVYRRWSHA